MLWYENRGYGCDDGLYDDGLYCVESFGQKLVGQVGMPCIFTDVVEGLGTEL